MCKKHQTQKSYVSSNLKYNIFLNSPKFPEDTCVLYDRTSGVNLYDLAETIYIDCFDYLRLQTPLRLEVIFNSRRNYSYTFIISDNSSLESVLKQLTQQFQI